MHERGALAAVVGLVALSAVGVGAIAWAPRWTPPADTDAANRRAYVVGIFEDPSARNPWAINGPNNTTWNSYVAAGEAPVLFSSRSGPEEGEALPTHHPPAQSSQRRRVDL